ncbi:hypothetical protein ACQP0C_17705 [Nocardia sp. CA-129566]|uniref:hypothetical protein n=1 Tax=Nocardia sp. CA-129566 TaxID=3239976 RepID=UPI003D98E721
MRLNIQRSQNEVRGMLGGSKGFTFTLSYRLDLTPAERGVVDKYKLFDYPVTFSTFQGTRVPDDTIGKMLNGASQTVNSVETLLKNEEVIKQACDSLPILFNVIQSFGGTEVIDYPRK